MIVKHLHIYTYNTLLLDITKDLYIKYSLKEHWSMITILHVKSFSENLKAHITSAANILIFSGPSKFSYCLDIVNFKEVHEKVFCDLLFPSLISSTCLCFNLVEC